jgi:integrase
VAEPAIKHAKLLSRGEGTVTLRVQHGPVPSNDLLLRSIISARISGANHIVVSAPTPEVENGAVEVEAMIGLWAQCREKPPSDDARDDKWRHMRRLFGFLNAGHNDMRRVATADIQRYKEHLIARVEAGEIERNTARDALIHIKALYQTATTNNKLTSNPAAAITVPPKHTRREKKRQIFDAADRKLILERAHRSDSPLIRWGTWIAAFTGAITEEIAEADSRDVETISDELVVLHIRLDYRPGGQELKTEYWPRPVPLHPAIIRDGEFVRYVRSLPPGPLFPELPLDRKGRRATKASSVIMRFLRETCEIKNPRKCFDSWRHTFKTLAREAHIEEQHSDAITGHSDGRVARTYGEFPMPLLLAEIEKIPDPTGAPVALLAAE